ncbi:prephenate dehydrogenase/arogenate dehydrogenase family protein [Chromobacterium sp. Beijing]|uniref:prephenate dehydrogenase n=1 Tax=Chromobacterium sp. Beijing TaxID=2735795 RepID=UPI001F2E7AA8|nr:prephenate dehydrogenase/arogenate dehydrogenase family protein [Chromobacterium sp. Beijing]
MDRGEAVQQGMDTLVVVGVGLIGGSFALSLKRAGMARHVIGVGRTRENLERALELGVVDEISQDLAAVAERADLVLLASPVGQMGALMAAMAPKLRPETIVTDAGSTKGDVVELYRRHLPRQLAHCVPAHPIAGSDLSGAAAAQYGLYENRKVVLTPLPETLPAAVERVAALWRACGADIHSMTAEEHDAVFATVSHLPHLLAFAYVDMVAGKADAERCFDFAATGFRDFTRIAGSHPEMWTDISLANRDALLQELDRYRAGLDQLRQMLDAGDGERLAERFGAARGARTRWHQQFMRKA